MSNENLKINGLTSEEVKQRINEGKVNNNCSVKTKSVFQIVCSNLLTLFNLVNVILAICVIMVQSYKNVLFMGVVFWNAFIGIYQEIRSKRIIDKLSILSSPSAIVIRDGQELKIKVDEIVLDDVIILRNGFQISADAEVISGECEVNESLLTGESDPIPKKKEDVVLSGSYVTSGEVYARVVHVGKDNYVNTITGQAKYLKKPNSQMMNSIKAIVKVVSICLIPTTACLFYGQISMYGNDFSQAVVRTVAAVIGMIPSGLVLLTSMVLAVSVIRLAKRNTLVQELFCIETLARVDVLCLDKTGTITEGSMNVEEVKIIDKKYNTNVIKGILKMYTQELSNENPTFSALKEYSNTQIMPEDLENEEMLEEYPWKDVSIVPFSSDKKWGAITSEKYGTYAVGALEYMVKETDSETLDIVHEYSRIGLRVLTIAHSADKIDDKKLPYNMKVVAVIAIMDKIRDEAYDTIEYFKKQGVFVKVISGDNPETVSYIAEKVGIVGADKYVDTSKLSDDELNEAVEKYSVFGRVRPDQKLTLVKALKAKGHVVAMTGDGVNDVLALKESDCSIAMQSGSDAARNVSNIVLMDSNFASMPHIVAEGRRTINNMQRSASLYLTKTIYSTALAVAFIILGMTYPFIPIQLTLVGALTIGIPSFILALEPNVNRVKGKFLLNVLRLALPGGMLVFTNVMVSQLFGHVVGAGTDQTSTMAAYALAMAALIELFNICKPASKIRSAMLGVLVTVFVVACIFFKDFFGFASLTLNQSIFMLCLGISAVILFKIYVFIIELLIGTTPNIYHIGLMRISGKKIMLINDDVDKKDYFDVTNMMKRQKILSADNIIFAKKSISGADIRIESEDDIEEDEIAAVAMYCAKKVKGKSKGQVALDIEIENKRDNVNVSVNLDDDRANFNIDDEEYSIKVNSTAKRKLTL